MTTMTKNPGPANPTVIPQRSGFQSIPTRIRDVRDGSVPPLVVEPIAEQNKAAICQTLSELGSKLAEIHRTAAEAYLSQSIYEQALPHLDQEAPLLVGRGAGDQHGHHLGGFRGGGRPLLGCHLGARARDHPLLVR